MSSTTAWRRGSSLKRSLSPSHFFGLRRTDERRRAIEKIGGNRSYSGLLHEPLDLARGQDMKEAFNIALDLAPDDREVVAGKPFPFALVQSQPLLPMRVILRQKAVQVGSRRPETLFGMETR